MYGNTPVWKDLDLNSIGYFTQMYVKDSSGGSGTGTGIGGNISHKCELKQAILVKLLYGTRYSGFFGIAFFLTNNVNTFYL